jgi:cbb3-type cytochrome oxidase maturation protein
MPMDVLIFLMPAALGLGFLGLLAFLWSMNNNQLDDLDGAAWRVLMDDDTTPPEPADRG